MTDLALPPPQFLASNGRAAWCRADAPRQWRAIAFDAQPSRNGISEDPHERVNGSRAGKASGQHEQRTGCDQSSELRINTLKHTIWRPAGFIEARTIIVHKMLALRKPGPYGSGALTHELEGSMWHRIAQTACCVGLFAGVFAAQTPARIDFGQDVAPILRQNCVSCHGPAQQMGTCGWTARAR